MKNKKILSILFTLLISYGYAQENWSFYNSTNTPTIGPIDNAVIDITTDTAENLWFATINGLSKYDGTKWESFLYSNDYYGADYNKIIIDKENTIWLSSPFEFGNFYRIKNNKYEEICEGKHIYDMALDTSGHIWLATLHGLLEYTDDKFIDYSDEHELLDELSSISFDKNNKLCVGTFQNGILYKKDTCWINISEADGLISNEVNDIDFDNENNLWVATNSGVSCYSSEGITNYTSQDGLCSNSIEKVYVDNENFIWFSSQDSGCCYFNGNNFIVYNTQTGLKDNFIRSIFKDKKKGVWIAYYDEGVDYLINDKIINYSGNGINHIDCLFEDQNNNIWVGTRQGGINVFDGTNWKNYNFSNGFINNTIYCITSDNQQNIWISVPDGLAKYDGNKFEYITKEDGLPGKYNLTMYFDNKNNLWLGTAKKGVFKFDGKKWTAYNKTNSLIRERVEAICQDDDGNMWFGAADSSSMWDGVICKFDGNNWYSYHPIQGYASSILNDSEGNLWFGLRASMFKDTSILKYDGVNWEPILLNLDEPYTDKTIITDIAEDNNGNIWFGRCWDGVSIYKHGKWEHKYPEEGYPVSTTNAILQDHTGNIWLGSYWNGIYKINYHNDIKDIKKKERFKISPNPVKDVLHIKNDNVLIKTTQVELYDVNGKLLYTNYYHSNYELNMSSYPKGVYIVKLKYFNYVYSKKIVKE